MKADASPPAVGRVVTFYSYKGGVGRSMSMASVAALLARLNLRVLAIDFDLEAPGLERYFLDAERCRQAREQPGLMDLILAYRKALTDESAFAEAAFERWSDFRLTAIHEASALGGSVDLMTAGRREPLASKQAYARAVRSFDWQDFFHNWKGDLFFDWFKRQLVAPGTGYDVVLVDSRTGVTEMGGVCAYQLADVAVLLCAPNFQNLDGTMDIVEDFRSEAVWALRRGRPLEILAIPARLAADHPRRQDFLDEFKRRLGVDALPAALADAGLSYENLALPYLPEYAVAEGLVATSGAETFQRLADALTVLADESTALGRHRGPALQRLRGGASDAPGALLADTTQSTAGFDVFIDHAQGDAELAESIAGRLGQSGLNCFLPGGGGADERVDEAQERALAYSRVLLVCFGQPTRGEARAHRIALARRQPEIRVVPVLLPGADLGALASFDLSEVQALDLREGHARLDALVDAVLGLTRRRSAVRESAPQRDPYPGARPHVEDDAGFFAGRDGEVDALAGLLQGHRVVLLWGASQVGKTSLVQAGLLPVLRRESSGQPAPFARLAVHDLRSASPPPAPAMLLAPGGRRQLLVLDHADLLPADDAPAWRERVHEVSQLAAATGERLSLLVVARDPARLLELLRAATPGEVGVFRLEALGSQGLRRAIEEPARRAGHLLEPGLAERLIEGAGAACSAIAAIQLALHELWRARSRGWLTNKCLDAEGQLAGLVRRHHARFMETLPPEQRAAAGVAFARLVTLSRGYQLLPGVEAVQELCSVPALARGGGEALVHSLASAFLLDLQGEQEGGLQATLSGSDATAYFDGNDSLVDLPFLLWREPLGATVSRWDGGAAGLLQGAALFESLEWLARRRDELSERETRFIDASARESERLQRAADEARRTEDQAKLQAAQQLAEARERANIRLRRWRYTLGAFLVAAVLMVVVAERLREAAMEQQRIAVQAREDEAVQREKAEALAKSLRNELDQRLAQYGVKASTRAAAVASPQLQLQIFQANAALESASITDDERARRRSTTVEYFARGVDDNKVEAALLGLGFTVRKPDAKFPGAPSNAIWFGSAARIDDVKLVALTLVRAGVRIVAIRPLQTYLAGKKDQALIQVGTDMSMLDAPGLTVEQIQKATEFKR